MYTQVFLTYGVFNMLVLCDVLFTWLQGHKFCLANRITFLHRPFRVTVSGAAIAAVSVCPESGSTRFSSAFCSQY